MDDPDALLTGVDTTQNQTQNLTNDNDDGDYEQENQGDIEPDEVASVSSNELDELKRLLAEEPFNQSTREDNSNENEDNLNENEEANGDAQSIDELIRELEARDQEIEDGLQSIQEEIRPTCERRAPEVSKINNTESKSYTNTTIENIIEKETIAKLSKLVTSG